jgi:hypothetical protein
MLTFVLGIGEAVRELFREEGLLFVLKSEIREPAAEGGGRGMGAWMISGLGVRAEELGVSARGGAGRLVI